MAMIHEITEKVGKHRRRKRVGRGPGSGHGKTSGRGHKGAKSRSGWSGSVHALYEGGQKPYYRRISKRGFSNARFRTVFAVVNVKILEANFKSGDKVDIAALAARHLVPNDRMPLKILGEGELTRKLTVTADKFSASAKQKIESAGGTANPVEKPAHTDK
jgi:large subunit ribosomal protein L15